MPMRPRLFAPTSRRRAGRRRGSSGCVHAEPLPPGETLEVEEVDYDAVVDLRREWNAEDFPGIDQESHLANARRRSRLTRDVRVIASLEDGEPVGFAQLEYIDGSAEVTHVFVSAKHRGSGRGTAITRAAVEAAIDDVDDLWIVADDEDRPKELYSALGFRPAWTTTEFLRLPPARRLGAGPAATGGARACGP